VCGVEQRWAAMSFRIRVGPVSVSSRGRVGVRAGPVYVAGGGGRRRRRPSGGGGDANGCLALVAVFVVVGVIGLAAKYWYITVPVALVLAAVFVAGDRLNKAQVVERQKAAQALAVEEQAAQALARRAEEAVDAERAEVERIQREARAEAERIHRDERAAADRKERAERAEADRIEREKRVAAWLAAPPSELELPGRFTETWFADRIPRLHPGQISVLESALRNRGWKDDRIRERIAPYLARNPWIR
jgi:hypothetical protein